MESKTEDNLPYFFFTGFRFLAGAELCKEDREGRMPLLYSTYSGGAHPHYYTTWVRVGVRNPAPPVVRVRV